MVGGGGSTVRVHRWAVVDVGCVWLMVAMVVISCMWRARVAAVGALCQRGCGGGEYVPIVSGGCIHAAVDGV